MDLDYRLVKSVRDETEKGLQPENDGSRLTYTAVSDDTGLSVRKVLKRRLGFSSRLLARLKRGEGFVKRNGVAVRLFADVLEGDIINVVLPEEKSRFIPEDIPVSVVYSDEDIMIIDKQPFVVVHPTHDHLTGSLANGLMKKMLDENDNYKIRFVNRLDRDTSGLVVVARNSHCQDAMIKAMKSGRVEKRYLAVVHGNIAEESGTIDLPIGRPSPDDVRRGVMEGGSPSVTHYCVKERYDVPAGKFTLLELLLETGRTHQIRVHLSHIGFPIVGDPLYGKEEPELIGRQALHAFSLRFSHPVTGAEIDVNAPPAQDIVELLKKIENSCHA